MAATPRKRQQQNRRPHKSNRIAATPDKKMKEGHAVVLAPSLHSCSERAGLISAAAVDPATNRFSGCAAECSPGAVNVVSSQSAVHRNVPAAESCRKGTQGRAAGG